MPKPYKKVRVKTKNGKYKYRYYSKLSNRFIKKEIASDDFRVQGRREAFPQYDAESWKRFDATMAEWAENQITTARAVKSKSPDIQRYIDYLIEQDQETLADIVEIELEERLENARDLSSRERLKRINRNLARKPRVSNASIPVAKKRKRSKKAKR